MSSRRSRCSERGQLTHLGRIPTTPEVLRAFAQTLGPDDQVVLEATGNTYAIRTGAAAACGPGRRLQSSPDRAIADAKIKTDKIDAEVLVRLLAGGWLPEVWVPDAETQALRQQVAHRVRLVRHHTRLKNRIHGVLHRNLIPGCYLQFQDSLQEWEVCLQAERAYAELTRNWQPCRPRQDAGATKGERR